MATTPYADLIFANDYFGERLNTDAWDAANDATKLKSLKQGTREMDVLEYIGFKTDEDQSNEFPRDGETEFPIEVQQANCEVAIALLEGQTLGKAFNKTNLQSEKVGDASKTYKEGGGASNFAEAGNLNSQMAYRLLKEFLADPFEFELLRTG